MIKVTQVRTASQMRRFVQFPLVLYKNCPHYVPAIYADERNILNPAKNPNLVDCEVRCYLAYKDGKAAGRIAAIEQKAYNTLSGRKCLRFSRFDCIDDREVAAALFAITPHAACSAPVPRVAASALLPSLAAVGGAGVVVCCVWGAGAGRCLGGVVRVF